MADYDFVAIGDIVTDAFIKIQDPNAHADTHDGKREICFAFGAKVPYESVTVIPGVGNSPNAAVAAARLGLRSAIVSDHGDDDHAKEQRATLERENVATEFLRNHSGIATNYHYVLWYREERTILIKHHAYEYSLPNIGNPKWIYVSSLGEQLAPYHAQIETFLDSHPITMLAYQPGTFQISLGYEKTRGMYERSAIFFCNTDEARRILKTGEQNGALLAKNISKLGPKIAVITDGPKGLYAHDSTTGATWFMPPYPDPKPPVDRTGAGDSFSSTVTIALLLGLPLQEALRWGPINSMSVVQYVGAQEGLLSRERLEAYLSTAPADYLPHRLD
ncbi:MAG: carbohydrate kinase family protein [Candidatus Vogelbacteria bacterium]|nr:carbohydrate kinase family protein [Candidatus Vogelbacteria bacterium]